MPNQDTAESNGGDGSPYGLIRSTSQAIIAVILTFMVLTSAFHSVVSRAPRNPWLFEPVAHSYLFGKPACIVLSIFYWCSVAWILFWFYKAARDRGERFLVGGFSVGCVAGIISGFLPLSAQISAECASIVAFLFSFASSLTIASKMLLGRKVAP